MQLPLVEAVQRRVAVVAIGPSAVRGKGNTGVASAAREFLASLSLASFAVTDCRAFREALKSATEQLQNSFPKEGGSWGLARKCVNLFLCDAFFNRYLHLEYGLAVAEEFFEIPLDGIVAKALSQYVRDPLRLLKRLAPLDCIALKPNGAKVKPLPTWPGVKHLTPLVSDAYQEVARDLAGALRITRVHLDTFLWVEGRTGANPGTPCPVVASGTNSGIEA
jgi:hypothetical protein